MSSTLSPATSPTVAVSGPDASPAPRLGAYALVAGSGFYLTQVLPLSPVYVLCAAAFGAMLWAAIAGVPARTRPRAPWPLVALLAAHAVVWLLPLSPLNSELGYLLNFAALAIAAVLFSQLRTAELWTCRVVLTWTTIALGAIEALVRWVFPFQELPADRLRYIAESGSAFYVHKFNSIMYQDSNFVGMWLLTVFLFQVRTPPPDGSRRAERVASALLLVLLALTTCRAALVVVGAYLPLRALQRSGRSLRLSAIVGGAVVVAAVAVFFVGMVADDSFQSKLLIFDLAISHVAGAFRLETLLFGSGVASSVDVLGGIAAHNYPLMLFLECGVLGLLCTAFLHAYYARRAPTMRGLLTCFHLAGLSMAPMTAPYLYVALQLGFELGRRASPELT